MGEAGNEETEAVLTAVRHGTRRTILRVLRDGGSDCEISPKGLADRLGMPLANVSYHIRILADCEVIRLTRTRYVRGSLQHFYEATELTDHPLTRATLDAEEKGDADDC